MSIHSEHTDHELDDLENELNSQDDHLDDEEEDGLDYVNGCVNFRDVAEFVNLFAEKEIIPEKVLLRGGSIDYVTDPVEIGNPGTIINLRPGDDKSTFGADYFHFILDKKFERYNTEQREVRTWLNEALKIFEDDNLRYPVMIHCLSGKDRTGILIASILLILGVSKRIILEEYLVSKGTKKSKHLLIQALRGIGDPSKYFNKLDIEKVRRNLLKNQFPKS
jgi:protein-tyrosine phosphatase